VWSTITGAPVADEYLDVWGPSANEIYVASTSGILTFNGTTWSTMAGFTETPRAIRGASGSDIWVSTLAGPLMHYNGTTWTDRSPTGATVQFLDVNAPDDVWAIGHVTVAQGTGIIAHYDGTAWQQWATTSRLYGAIASSGPSDVWVAALDGVMRHWDGVGWSNSTNIGASPSGLTLLSGLLSLGPSEVVGVSTLDLAYRYRGQSFGLIVPLGPDPFTATNNTAMWSTGPNNVWVGNAKGELWHFNGIDWELAYTTVAGRPINDLWGTSAMDVWAVSVDSNVYHFDGVQWTADSIGNVGTLERVWSAPGGAVFAFAGGAYRKVGDTWPYTDLGGIVSSVSGSGPDNVWVVTRAPSAVWRFDGTSWTEVATGTTAVPLAVAVLGADDVHVTAVNGRFLHFNGTAWTESQLAVLADLVYIEFSAPDDIIAASERDILHFNGRTWSTMRPPVDFTPNSSDYLPMVGLNVTPGRIDFMLQRYRIRTLIRTRPLICRQVETCGDGVDNDCDNDLDSRDSECP
jgi:hypothetical protein